MCARRKKKGLRLNGKAGIHIKTLHGTFVFAEQRLLWADGSDSRYLAATLQEAESVGLQEFGVYFCNRLSFHEVAALLERVSGVPLVCEQTLWNWVQARAALRDARLAQDLTACQALSFPELADTVDLYAAEAEEVLILTDGIGVKAQKPTRQKAGTPACTKLDKRHDTDVLLLEGVMHFFACFEIGLYGLCPLCARFLASTKPLMSGWPISSRCPKFITRSRE